MDDWKAFADKTRLLFNSKKFTQALNEVQSGLEKYPNQVRLLILASDIFRASNNHEKSLEYADLIITHYPDKPSGYFRSAQDLLILKSCKEAQDRIKLGLDKFPDHVNLLTTASDVYRVSDDREKSLHYAELLITHHPDKLHGYGRAVQDLIVLERFEEAQDRIKLGLDKFPNHVNLLTIASVVYRASDDRERSLHYAELLITHYPEKWQGYGRAAQDLIVLERLEEAQAKINLGLDKLPNHVNLLTIASDAYRASSDHEKSLNSALLLITHHPDEWRGYCRAAEELVALKRFYEARQQIQAGLEIFPNQVNLKKYLAYINSFLGIRLESISNSEKDNIKLSQNDLIAYSSIPDFYRIIQSKRIACFEEFKTHKSYLFVAGLGRSGTTALGNLLNISSLIEMYTELYSPYRIEGYLESDFSQNMILEKLKVHLHGKQDSLIFFKNQHSKVIGDKRPHFQFCAESSFDNIGKGRFKCIFIDRSLVDICRSSHRRSVNKDDHGWGLERGVEHTILVYNASCRQINYFYDNRPDVFSSFLFPSYENIFSCTESAIKLFDFCGVELSEEELKEAEFFIDDSRKYVKKKIDLTNHLEAHIKESLFKLLDREAHEKFCDITGNRRNYCLDD